MEVERISRLQGGSIPYRINSSYCQLSSNGKPYLFVFGGFDDTNENFDDRIYVLDIERQSWLESRSTGIYRNGCSCVPMDNKGNILIVGGILPDDECMECLDRSGNIKSKYQDCFLLNYNIEFNAFNMEWNDKFKENINDSTGNTGTEITLAIWEQINRLERHSIYLSLPNNRLYISGGVISDLPYGMQKNMYIFDFKKFKIDKVEFCRKIEHEIIEFDNKIWSFGGLNETMKNSFMNIQIYDLIDNTVDDLNLNINNTNLLGQNIKKKSPTIGYKKFFYNQISKNQILITDLLNYQFIVLNKDTFKMYQAPIQIENLYWLFVFTYNDNLSIIGGKELNDTNDEVAYLDCQVAIPLGKFGKIETTNQLENHSLVEKFQHAYKEEKFVDFKIRSNDNKELKVHRLYLLLQWPYFERVIMSGMLESRTNEMCIDEPFHNIKLLIDYLYTNEFPILKINELLQFAHLIELYDLSNLKSVIVNRIYSTKIQINQLIEYWQLSDLLNSEHLKKYIQSLIFKYWGYIVRLPSFQSLEKEKMLELFTNLELESQIVTVNQDPSSYGSTNSLQALQSNDRTQPIVTPETEVYSTFETTFRSPGVVDYWTPLEPQTPDHESSSSDSFMGE